MNNPKIDFVLDILGLEENNCDLVLINYSEGKCVVYCYQSTSKKKGGTDNEDIPLADFCELLNTVTNQTFGLGTEDIDRIYNLSTHQRLLAASLSLPASLLQLQYEDSEQSGYIDYNLEELIRDTFEVV